MKRGEPCFGVLMRPEQKNIVSVKDIVLKFIKSGNVGVDACGGIFTVVLDSA